MNESTIFKTFDFFLFHSFSELRLCKSFSVLQNSHAEHSRAFTSLNYAFMAMEGIINYLCEYYFCIELPRKGNSLEEIRNKRNSLKTNMRNGDICEKWKKYPSFINNEIKIPNDEISVLWEKFIEIKNYRNNMIHSNFINPEKIKRNSHSVHLDLPLDGTYLSFNHAISSFSTCVSLIEYLICSFEGFFVGQELLKNGKLVVRVQNKSETFQFLYDDLISQLKEKVDIESLYLERLELPLSATNSLHPSIKAKIDQVAPPGMVDCLLVAVSILSMSEDGFSGSASFNICGYGIGSML